MYKFYIAFTFSDTIFNSYTIFNLVLNATKQNDILIIFSVLVIPIIYKSRTHIIPPSHSTSLCEVFSFPIARRHWLPGRADWCLVHGGVRDEP